MDENDGPERRYKEKSADVNVPTNAPDAGFPDGEGCGLILDEHRVSQDEIDVVEVVDVKLEFTAYRNEIINLKTTWISCEIHLRDRLRAASTAKEALTHGELRYNNVVITLRSKRNIVTRDGYFFSCQVPHFGRKLRIKNIFPQCFIEPGFELRL